MSKKITITIDEHLYENMKRAQKFLECLEECGVYNWEGYPDALNLMGVESEDVEDLDE